MRCCLLKTIKHSGRREIDGFNLSSTTQDNAMQLSSAEQLLGWVLDGFSLSSIPYSQAFLDYIHLSQDSEGA